MSQDNKKSFVMYQGNGSNNVFSVPMTKGKYGTISVAFVRRGLDQYEYNPITWGLNGGLYAWSNGSITCYTDTDTPAIGANVYDRYGVDTGDTVAAIGGATITVNTTVYTRNTLGDVDENTVLTWTGATLNVGDYIVIERNTTLTQPFEFVNNQKHIEKSDDNQERQIQELADKIDSALRIDPTYLIDSNKMNPIRWLNTIVRSVDFSIRGLRYANGWLDYSLDDPNIADGDKTWYHLLNTDNIKSIRERKEIIDNIEHCWVEYLDQNGEWKTISDSSWEGRIEEVERIANEAHDIAEEALDVANDANDKSDDAVDYARQAMDAVAGISGERFVFTIEEGQSTLHFDDDIEDKIIDLYWQGQYLIQSGNWTVSGDTITMLFDPEEGDTVVVILSTIRQTVERGDLNTHNIDPTAHANIINTHNTSLSAHANLLAVHNADNSAHATLLSTTINTHNTSASAHSTLFDAKATKVTVRRW